MKHIISIGTGAVFAFGLLSCNSTPKLNENNIEDVVAAMKIKKRSL